MNRVSCFIESSYILGVPELCRNYRLTHVGFGYMVLSLEIYFILHISHSFLDLPFCDDVVLGTPNYMSPELILCHLYGHGVDWWSLGIILYKMLTGSHPYVSRTNTEILEEIIDGKYNWISLLSHKIIKNILHILYSSLTINLT